MNQKEPQGTSTHGDVYTIVLVGGVNFLHSTSYCAVFGDV